MAITFPTVFQSAIATNPLDTAAGNLTPTRYNQGCSVAGLSSTSGALLYSTDATTLAQDGTNFLYTTAIGPRLQVGSSGTSTGIIAGYEGTNTGFSAIWASTVTPSASNYAIRLNSGQTAINSGSGAQNSLYLMINNTARLTVNPAQAAGSGVLVEGGTATTDVAALSVTRTNNNAAVGTTVPWVSWDFTDTTSNAAALAFRIRGGASASTNLLSVSKAGLVNAPAYAVGGTNGASFGPGAVASITVVNGIITAIS